MRLQDDGFSHYHTMMTTTTTTKAAFSSFVSFVLTIIKFMHDTHTHTWHTALTYILNMHVPTTESKQFFFIFLFVFFFSVAAHAVLQAMNEKNVSIFCDSVAYT